MYIVNPGRNAVIDDLRHHLGGHRNDHQVQSFLLSDRGQRFLDNPSSGLANDIAYQQDSHSQLLQEVVTAKLIEAVKILPKVKIREEFLRITARMCIELDVDGHRPDIIITRAAMAKAAYEGRLKVNEEDLRFASELTLGFRMRRSPFEEAALGADKFQQVLDYAKKQEAEEKKKKRKAKSRQVKKTKGKAKPTKKATKPVSKKKTSYKK